MILNDTLPLAFFLPNQNYLGHVPGIQISTATNNPSVSKARYKREKLLIELDGGSNGLAFAHLDGRGGTCRRRQRSRKILGTNPQPDTDSVA